ALDELIRSGRLKSKNGSSFQPLPERRSINKPTTKRNSLPASLSSRIRPSTSSHLSLGERRIVHSANGSLTITSNIREINTANLNGGVPTEKIDIGGARLANKAFKTIGQIDRLPAVNKHFVASASETEYQNQKLKTSTVNQPVTLLITNLDERASADDVKIVFSQIGKLIRSGVRKAPGGGIIAEVVYEQKSDAEKAIAQYHNQLVD
ncbi:hypothetical protein HK096_010757, partial [Nowakowskiella sp. JEL0078]